MKQKYLILLLGIQLAAAKIGISAQITIKDTPVDTMTIISNLDTPWEILWGHDDHIWITERSGRISRLNPRTGELTQVGLIPEVNEQGEGGLLGMVLHPDFQNSPQVFLVYNYKNNSVIKERLVRYSYESGSLVDPVILLDGIDGAGNHNGSRLVIDSAHMLYMTTGDAANTSTSQILGSLNGKVLRLHLDGSIPDDNPIPGSPVWSWGHRNPQGLVITPSGILYSSEHGPSSDDELNIIEKGRNYGWPTVRGFCNEPGEQTFCADSGVNEPIAAWTPTLAVCGTDYYPSEKIPAWNNSILVTSLKASRLVALKLSENGMSVIEENQYFTDWFGRLRDLCVSPSGDLYLATSNHDGRGQARTGDDRIVKISAVPGATGIIDQPRIDDSMRIYPNPVTGNTIVVEYTPSENALLTVYNESGSCVLSEIMDRDRGLTQIILPAPPGMYLVRIQDGAYVKSRRVIKYQ